MSINSQYSNAESALHHAFVGPSSLCSVVCECGRCYFVTARGHGDYDDGELDGYKSKAEKDPDKYVECWAFDCVDLVRIGNRELVIQCACGEARRYLEFFEQNRDQLADFIAERLKEEIGELERQIEHARRRSRAMDDWNRARSPDYFRGSGI